MLWNSLILPIFHPFWTFKSPQEFHCYILLLWIFIVDLSSSSTGQYWTTKPSNSLKQHLPDFHPAGSGIQRIPLQSMSLQFHCTAASLCHQSGRRDALGSCVCLDVLLKNLPWQQYMSAQRTPCIDSRGQREGASWQNSKHCSGQGGL